MINRDELVSVGRFRKPHGNRGEIACSFTDAVADSRSTDVVADLTRNPGTGTFLICEIDGIFVPFRIDNYRPISDSSAYIQLRNIDSEAKARELSHKEVYLHKKHLKKEFNDDSSTRDYFIGFTIIDEKLGVVGRIVDIDRTTINTLFIVERGNEEILIPAAEDFILRVDENRKELTVSLPEGLV